MWHLIFREDPEKYVLRRKGANQILQYCPCNGHGLKTCELYNRSRAFNPNRICFGFFGPPFAKYDFTP